MPKIPVNRQTAMIQHVRATTPINAGGQHLQFYKSNTAEALINAGAKIGNASAELGQKMMAFSEKLQYTEDRLAATEAKNLYRNLQSDLQKRMTANPGQYDQFGEWAKETDKTYADQVQTITSRMSGDFRRQFDAEMEGLRKETIARRENLGMQGRVTADYTLFQAQWKDAALRGDLNECNRLLEYHRGNLITEQEYQQKKLEYNRFAEYGEVKRLVETDSPGIIGKLKERNDKGEYANYRNLEESARDRFLRIAEAKDSLRRSDENAELLEKMNAGEEITLDDIEAKFKDKKTPEDLRQYREQMQIVRKILHSRSGYKAKVTAEKEKQQYDNFRWTIYDYKFAADDATRQKQYALLRTEILTRYADDGEKRLALTEKLDARFKAAAEPQKSVHNTSLYKDGTALIDTFKMQGKLFADRNWNVADDKRPGTISLIEKKLRMDLEDFVSANPDGKLTDLQKHLEEKTSIYNKSYVDDIGNMAIQQLQQRRAGQQIKARMQMYEGRTGTFNGKKVIYKNGKIQYAQ